MDYNWEDESKPYSSDDAYEDLEKLKEMLHDAQRKINRGKLEKSDIDLSINIEMDDNNK